MTLKPTSAINEQFLSDTACVCSSSWPQASEGFDCFIRQTDLRKNRTAWRRAALPSQTPQRVEKYNWMQIQAANKLQASGHLWSRGRLFMTVQANLLSVGGPVSFFAIRLDSSRSRKQHPHPESGRWPVCKFPENSGRRRPNQRKPNQRGRPHWSGAEKIYVPSRRGQGKRTRRTERLIRLTQSSRRICV